MDHFTARPLSPSKLLRCANLFPEFAASRANHFIRILKGVVVQGVASKSRDKYSLHLH